MAKPDFHVLARIGSLASLVRPAVWVAGFALLSTPAVFAHKPSDSYLTLTTTHSLVSGQWDIALRDLEHAIGLDANDDGVITWGELRSRWSVVDAYILAHLKVSNGSSAGTLRITDRLVDTHTDGAYAVLRFVVDGLQPSQPLELEYSLFFDLDPQHRGLLRVENADGTRTAVLSPEHPTQRFEPGAPEPARALLSFVREGVWHIWTGYDHMLFLLALLLPSVLRRRDGLWAAVEELKPALLQVLKVVTAFTAAHSLTLSLAATGVVQLPSRLVESAIAASVVLAAVNNLHPFLRDRVWLAAFAFGLVHGFGFASVLSGLGLGGANLVPALVGFNLGVEAGQLFIVLLFVPLAYGLRTSWVYQRVALQLGSGMILLLASVWLAERALDFKWMPF